MDGAGAWKGREREAFQGEGAACVGASRVLGLLCSGGTMAAGPGRRGTGSGRRHEPDMWALGAEPTALDFSR